MKDTIIALLKPQMMMRLLVSTVGIAMTCFAVSIFYLTDLGSDPYQVLCISVHLLLGISHGTANTLLNGFIILFMLLFKRKYIKISVFLCLAVSGPMVDFFNFILTPVIGPWLPLWIRFILIPLGCFLMGAGIFVYTAPNLGASPADSLGIIAADSIGKPYHIVRIGMDAGYTFLGALLGGPVGLTTIFSILLTGPCMGFVKKHCENLPFFRALASCTPEH